MQINFRHFSKLTFREKPIGFNLVISGQPTIKNETSHSKTEFKTKQFDIILCEIFIKGFTKIMCAKINKRRFKQNNMIVKILGFLDLLAAIALFTIIFGLSLPIQIVFFFGGILFMKSLLMFTGDVLSIFDFLSAILFFISLFFAPWTFILWTCSLVLMTKGVASFF